MDLAASSICWHRDTRAGMLRKASESGFRFVEILTFPPELNVLHGNLWLMKPNELRAELTEYGLEPAALHLGAIQTSTEQRRQSLTDYAKRAIDFAAELGCALIVEGGPDRATEPFQPFLRSLEHLARFLEGYSVRIGLENHYNNWIQYTQDYEHIFDRIDSPKIGITLDSGHFTSAGVDPALFAGKFADKVIHVHVKDHIGIHSVALGSGETNNKGMVRALKQAGYDGFLSQELEVADADQADHYAREGLKYLRMLADL